MLHTQIYLKKKWLSFYFFVYLARLFYQFKIKFVHSWVFIYFNKSKREFNKYPFKKQDKL